MARKSFPKMQKRETYPVDIDPGQIVRWITAECEAAPQSFRSQQRARKKCKSFLVQKRLIWAMKSVKDLSEVTSIAMLEIAPSDESDGWLLRVT